MYNLCDAFMLQIQSKFSTMEPSTYKKKTRITNSMISNLIKMEVFDNKTMKFLWNLP